MNAIRPSRIDRAALAALVLAVATSGAYAQTPVLEEITVTARKRDENLQEVPLTVTAITKDVIERANIDSGFDLAAFTPGFVFEDLGSRQASKPIIRGLTTNSISPADQKNSSFIDGTYVSGTASSLPFIAFDRVEVLKGPQSAAFGRATFGGAINYVTKDPGDRFNIAAEAEAGTDETLAAGLEVSGPSCPASCAVLRLVGSIPGAATRIGRRSLAPPSAGGKHASAWESLSGLPRTGSR